MTLQNWINLLESKGYEIISIPGCDTYNACLWVQEGNKIVNTSSAYWISFTDYSIN